MGSDAGAEVVEVAAAASLEARFSADFRPEAAPARQPATNPSGVNSLRIVQEKTVAKETPKPTQYVALETAALTFGAAFRAASLARDAPSWMASQSGSSTQRFAGGVPEAFGGSVCGPPGDAAEEEWVFSFVFMVSVRCLCGLLQTSTGA